MTENEKGEKDAYLTVYLTLVLAVVLSLCLTLIEGTRKNTIYLEAECVTDIGLNSVLAEYHRELLNQYNLFAIDTSYGTALSRVQNTENRLQFYLKKNISRDDVFLDWLLYRDFLGMQLEKTEVTRVRFLTDGNGSVFRRRAAEAMWDDSNLSLLGEWQNWMQTVESNQLTEQDIAEQKHQLDEELKEYEREEQISETEWITVTVPNPTDYLEAVRRKGILNLAIENPDTLSKRYFVSDNLIESRAGENALNQGNWKLEENPAMDEMLERFLFQEYLMRSMSHYQAETDAAGNHVLAYQIEYLIAGKETDIENLKQVVNYLFAIREAANTSYLYSDQEKRAVAEGVASVLASLATIPEAAEVLTQILLLGWAFAESVYDVKCLMAGGKVPLMKNSRNWHYSLENALNVGGMSGSTSAEGVRYEDYLRIFLTLEDLEEMTVRSMNMVEADLRLMPGNEAFRLDGCVDALEACVHFKSIYGYDCEITRQKGYSTQ